MTTHASDAVVTPPARAHLRALPSLDPATLHTASARPAPTDKVRRRSGDIGTDRSASPATSPRVPGAGAPVASAIERSTHLVASFGRVALEVLQGRRPTAQLSRWLNDEAALAVSTWAREPVWRRARLGSSRACPISDRVVEGCVRLDIEGRSMMIALRLERRRRQWVCTSFTPLRSRGLAKMAA